AGFGHEGPEEARQLESILQRLERVARHVRRLQSCDGVLRLTNVADRLRIPIRDSIDRLPYSGCQLRKFVRQLRQLARAVLPLWKIHFRGTYLRIQFFDLVEELVLCRRRRQFLGFLRQRRQKFLTDFEDLDGGGRRVLERRADRLDGKRRASSRLSAGGDCLYVIDAWFVSVGEFNRKGTLGVCLRRQRAFLAGGRRQDHRDLYRRIFRPHRGGAANLDAAARGNRGWLDLQLDRWRHF